MINSKSRTILYQKKSFSSDFFVKVLRFLLENRLNKLSQRHLKRHRQLAVFSFDYVSNAINIDGVYEVDELVDEMISWDEFVLAYYRNVSDNSGSEPSNFFQKVSTSCLSTSAVLMKNYGQALSMLMRRVGSDHLSCGAIPDRASFLSAGEAMSETNSNNGKLWAAKDFETVRDLSSLALFFNAALMALSKRTSPFLVMVISSAYAIWKAFISSFTSFNCALAH